MKRIPIAIVAGLAIIIVTALAYARPATQDTTQKWSYLILAWNTSEGTLAVRYPDASTDDPINTRLASIGEQRMTIGETSIADPLALSEALDFLGGEAWELVSTGFSPANAQIWIYTFKRPKDE
jgi:hypothetical protein